MAEEEGTYSQLVEIAQKKEPETKAITPPRPRSRAPNKPAPAEAPAEDLSTTPYISQNYRFTEDELRWIRRQSYNLTEKLGAKVSQNTVLRIALQFLRDACAKNPKNNPLMETASRLKK